MERIDFEIDDFMNNCDYKNLSRKTMKSYEHSLRLFVKYLNDRNEEEKRSPITKTEQIKEKDIKDYITNTKERGKYTVLIDECTRKTNNPTNRGDFGKKVSIATINNYTRNLRVYFNYMYDNRLIKVNPMQRIKPSKTPHKAKDFMLHQIILNKQ